MKPRPAPSSRRSFLRDVALGTGAFLLAPRLSAAPTRRLGVALAGLGSYASGQLAPALRETQWCRLTGVVTGDRSKGERWAREYGFPEANIFHYDTMDELAGNPDIDIVYVVTPPGLHARDTIAAARAGKHVICEKPMANSVAECDAMIGACRDHGVKLSIGYRLVFEPHHREMDRIAREQVFGRLNRQSGAFGFPLRARGAWRLDRELAGGGPLMDVGIYVIQAACRAAGNVAPVAVSAREHPRTDPSLFDEVEEGLDFTLYFANGEACAGQTSYGESMHFFRAEGDRGWLELQPAYSYRGIEGRTSEGPMDFPAVNQQALQMDDFARCILDDRASPVGGELGRMHMAVIEAIYASAAANGRRTEVRV